MRCAFARKFIDDIADVLNYMAKLFKAEYPRLHERCVEAAKSHGIPPDTPGYPHQMVVLNVMRTKKPHIDAKDGKGHLSIDMPFGTWQGGGNLQLIRTKNSPNLNRYMPLKSGDIGVGNFKTILHNVSELGKGVRCSLLLICHAKYFSTSHPYKKQLDLMESCTDTKRCHLCRKHRQKLTKEGVVSELEAWAESL